MDNQRNRTAFLTMIAVSEGTADQGDRGYNVIVGSRPGRPNLFASYMDHPRVKIRLRDGVPGKTPPLDSTAAGRYQELEENYDFYKRKLDLPDFSPASQDAMALQQIEESHAMEDIDAGRLTEAIQKCKHLWASFKGAGYGQHENTLESMTAAFVAAGGSLAAAPQPTTA